MRTIEIRSTEIKFSVLFLLWRRRGRQGSMLPLAVMIMLLPRRQGVMTPCLVGIALCCMQLPLCRVLFTHSQRQGLFAHKPWNIFQWYLSRLAWFMGIHTGVDL